MVDGAVITGDRAIMRRLMALRTTAAKRAMQKGLNKGAQYGAKAVKKSVPSRYKDTRKAIGWRAIRRSQTGGEPASKVGAAVGKRKKAQQARQSRRNGSGVGISTQNIHWMFIGTTIRAQKKTGKNTGAMPSRLIPPVDETLQQHKFTLAGIIRKNTLIGIENEVRKLK
jgi:hypothetical protein